MLLKDEHVQALQAIGNDCDKFLTTRWDIEADDLVAGFRDTVDAILDEIGCPRPELGSVKDEPDHEMDAREETFTRLGFPKRPTT